MKVTLLEQHKLLFNRCYLIIKISWAVKSAQLFWAFSLPLIRQLIFCYSKIQSGYIITISLLTFPWFLIGIIHFL